MAMKNLVVNISCMVLVCMGNALTAQWNVALNYQKIFLNSKQKHRIFGGDIGTTIHYSYKKFEIEAGLSYGEINFLHGYERNEVYHEYNQFYLSNTLKLNATVLKTATHQLSAGVFWQIYHQKRVKEDEITSEDNNGFYEGGYKLDDFVTDYLPLKIFNGYGAQVTYTGKFKNKPHYQWRVTANGRYHGMFKELIGKETVHVPVFNNVYMNNPYYIHDIFGFGVQVGICKAINFKKNR